MSGISRIRGTPIRGLPDKIWWAAGVDEVLLDKRWNNGGEQVVFKISRV